MKLDFVFSIGLHLLILAAVLLSAPFSFKKPDFNYDQVIRVRAISMPEVQKNQPVAMEPLNPPAAIEDDNVEIPLEDPTSVEEPKAIDKPKPKPKPKKKPTEKPATQTKQETTEETSSGGKEIETENTGKGSPFAGATVDDANFDYPYWFDQAFNKIAMNFKRTVSLDGNVIVVLYFKVIQSGRLLSVEVKQSSGFEAIDSDCIAAVKRAAPFPPLPREFRKEIIGITLPIKY